MGIRGLFGKLYGWARSTAPESQFLIPPNLKSFRLFAERAVVVDWQTTPWKPFEIIEWYRRLGRISGTPDLRTVEEAEAGYAEMDRARLESLEKEFGVDYVVFRRPFDVRQVRGAHVEEPQVTGKIAFMNDSYLVLKVQDETIARGGSHTPAGSHRRGSGAATKTRRPRFHPGVAARDGRTTLVWPIRVIVESRSCWALRLHSGQDLLPVRPEAHG